MYSVICVLCCKNFKFITSENSRTKEKDNVHSKKLRINLKSRISFLLVFTFY